MLAGSMASEIVYIPPLCDDDLLPYFVPDPSHFTHKFDQNYVEIMIHMQYSLNWSS